MNFILRVTGRVGFQSSMDTNSLEGKAKMNE